MKITKKQSMVESAEMEIKPYLPSPDRKSFALLYFLSYAALAKMCNYFCRIPPSYSRINSFGLDPESGSLSASDLYNHLRLVLLQLTNPTASDFLPLVIK